MTDSDKDLTQRLRQYLNSKYEVTTCYNGLRDEAADRIDELVKERDDYAHKLMDANNTYTEMHLSIERISDKLTKAVEALQRIAEHPYTWHTLARKTLAKLEGEK